MNASRNTAVVNGCQGIESISLSDSDRRLLIRSSLTLFLRRLNHGVPVLRDDLLRVAFYAPEQAERA